MKHLIRLSDFGEKGIYEVFRLADELRAGKHREALHGKTAVLFFPSASLSTRVTFEKGVASLGGLPILFPPETLDKKEDLRDVAGYLLLFSLRQNSNGIRPFQSLRDGPDASFLYVFVRSAQ